MEEYNEVVKVTGMNLAQIMLYPEEAGKKFVEMGGKIDANGKIIVSADSKIKSLGESTTDITKVFGGAVTSIG